MACAAARASRRHCDEPHAMRVANDADKSDGHRQIRIAGPLV